MISLAKQNSGLKIACENRKARHDYFIHDTYEAGIELKGTEVKSLRAGRANLKDSYGEVKNGEVFIQHLHISPYDHGSNYFNHDPLRPRRLLLHKAEITKLFSKTREKGFTIVPLKIYFKRGRAKMEIALASGKHTYDKRQDLAAKAAKRDVEREMKDRQKF